MNNLDIVVIQRTREGTRGKKVFRFAEYVAALCKLPDPDQQRRPEILLKGKHVESEHDELEDLAERAGNLLDDFSHDVFGVVGEVDMLKLGRPWANRSLLRDRHW